MRLVLFYHTLVSDWNHGNAHFLRGIATELLARGHDVQVFEPRDAWSVQRLLADHGQKPIRKFHAAYPGLRSVRYDPTRLDLDAVLGTADVVMVHEWNPPGLVRRIGEHRARGGRYRLLFHDTHHRMVTAPAAMAEYELGSYDGVLAYGAALKARYDASGRVRRTWVWHEAADTRVFRPWPEARPDCDLVWIGNWGDDERTAEIDEFLIRPAKALQLQARVHGVRYPEAAQRALADAGIAYGGWLPNFEVPRAFARARCTVHLPRRPYVRALPGIPTIRPFEALACGIPLVCAPWEDTEGLFRPGRDFLVARDGEEMKSHLRALRHEPDLARALAASGLETIRRRHTCAHRVDELLGIVASLNRETSRP